jgi:hypothetical protein
VSALICILIHATQKAADEGTSSRRRGGSVSRASTARKTVDREATKRLVLKENDTAAYIVGASARSRRGTPGKLPPLLTKGGNSGHQSSSSGTELCAFVDVETAEAV